MDPSWSFGCLRKPTIWRLCIGRQLDAIEHTFVARRALAKTPSIGPYDVASKDVPKVACGDDSASRLHLNFGGNSRSDGSRKRRRDKKVAYGSFVLPAPLRWSRRSQVGRRRVALRELGERSAPRRRGDFRLQSAPAFVSSTASAGQPQQLVCVLARCNIKLPGHAAYGQGYGPLGVAAALMM